MSPIRPKHAVCLLIILTIALVAVYPVPTAATSTTSASSWHVATKSLSPSAIVSLGSPIAYKQTGASALGWSKTGEPLLYVSATGAGSDHLYRYRLGETQPSGDYPFPGNGGQLWSMVALENGDVYFTCNHNLFKYSATQDRVITLGRPHPQTTMIWQLAVAPDGIIYGATYPKSRIFMVDPTNDQLIDLGAVTDTEYARSIAVSERYVFVGTGPELDLIAYDRQTGDKRSILPEHLKQGTGFVANLAVGGNRLFAPSGTDTSVALVFDTDTLQLVTRVFGFSYPISPVDSEGRVWFRMSGANPYAYTLATDTYRQSALVMPATSALGWAKVPESAVPEARRALFKGTSLIGITGNNYWALNPQSSQALIIPIEVPAAPARINSLAASNGKVYGGAFSPGGLFIYDPAAKSLTTTDAYGQTDCVTWFKDKLYFGTYTGAQLKVYNPESVSVELLGRAGNNQDRTVAMIAHQEQIYVGTVPDYGLQGGVLAVINPADNRVQSFYDIIPDHSIVALAGAANLVFGGTSTQGGLGKAPVPGDAYLFAWDITTQQLAWSLQPLAEPVIGALTIGADGLLWGAGTHSIFALDPATRQVVLTHRVLSAGSPSYSLREAFAASYKQYVVLTLNQNHMIIIDTAKHSIQVLPGRYNRIAIDDTGALYFTRGTELFHITPEVWMQL